MLLGACSSVSVSPREKICFNDNWSFSLSDNPKASETDFDDKDWRVLNLPHDWAIEGDFSKDNPSSDKIIRIDFDGIYMNSEVFINGQSLGKRPYGYIPFGYDITPYLKWNEKNVIAVRVDNSEQPNSRWYSGCGIYRNVWLTKTNPVHVDEWGTYVTTSEISNNNATLNIVTTVQNSGKNNETVTLKSILNDMDGSVVAETESSVSVVAGQKSDISHTLTISSPILWDTENPYLYSLVTEIIKDDKCIDRYTTTTGIRDFRFDAEKGFILNGKQTKINGVCMHHDLGCLGAAVNTRAIERQLEILKEMGCNGIRCSHNPPAPELLDLCDKMGFIVMDEAFDMWRKKKTSHDYARYFNEWHEKDLRDFILRDRNHPSIFVWSIGNEVLEQWSDAKADTLSLEEANLILNFGHSADMLAKDGEMSVNSLLTKKLADFVRELDPTRPITAGCNEPNPGNHLFKSGALDIIGYNYHNANIPDVPKNFPGKPFIITESNSALMTRGYYRMPSNEMFIWPERWDKPFYDESFSCSSYENCHVPWGNTHEENIKLVRNNDFISGQYIWTGFDYIGEPTPYGWPARSSYFGIVDLAGFPKDVYYLYKAEWTNKQVLHLFPHWNWTEGQEIDMWCYYNNADEVELIIAEKEIHTAGTPHKIRLTPDRNIITADGKDLSFVTVEVLDKDNNLCPLSENLINFEIKGNAFIAGVDNGCQTSMERFKDNKRKAFNGKCLVVLQNNGEIGTATLTANSNGLESSTIEITSK